MNKQMRFVAKAILSVIIVSFINGCGEPVQKQIQLKFQPGQSDTYVSSLTAVKDYEFNQPGLGKSDSKQAAVTSRIKFRQNITNVDPQGTATADITIKELFYSTTDKDKAEYIFDSRSDKYASDSLNKLIGKTYKIKITPAGKASIVDVSQLYSAVESGREAKIARALFSEERIVKRHTIKAMPKEKMKNAYVGQSWTEVEDSPQGLLMKTKYQKKYTIEDITNDGKAIVKLESIPSKPEHEYQMQAIQEMIDTEDDYTGTMTFDLQTGKVRSMHEKLVVTYTAIEQNEKGTPPDMLTMGFTQEIKLEKIN